MPPLIVLFTDFGLEGPYVGQVRLALWREAPDVPVFDLFADAPTHRPCEAAYLLAAYADAFPPGAVFLCVVDPGVGGERPAEALHIDGKWFVGPGNGLFELLLRRGRDIAGYRILPPLAPISASFHGRDLFAPVAGKLACSLAPDAAGLEPAGAARRSDWPDELAAIVYIDRFGNLMTGLRAATLPAHAVLTLGHERIERAHTFSSVPDGAPFWYENSNGLAEIAINRGRADRHFDAAIGTGIQVLREA